MSRGEVQGRFVEQLRTLVDGRAEMAEETCPDWLLRPGREEARAAWSTLQALYAPFTGQQLPEVAPPRECRRVDAILTWADGTRQIVEVDEVQHFTPERLTTLRLYPAGTPLGFPVDVWRELAAVERPRRGGGFGRPRPPLFPAERGRHAQRAFRDALADLLPLEWGWRPIVRITDLLPMTFVPDEAGEGMTAAAQPAS